MKNRVPDSIYAVCSEESDFVYYTNSDIPHGLAKDLIDFFGTPLTDNESTTAKKGQQ